MFMCMCVCVCLCIYNYIVSVKKKLFVFGVVIEMLLKWVIFLWGFFLMWMFFFVLRCGLNVVVG